MLDIAKIQITQSSLVELELGLSLATLKLDEILLFGNKNLSKIPDKIGTSINIHSDESDLLVGKMDIVSKSYKGNLLPNLDIWFKDMMEDGQTADNGSWDSLHDGEGDSHGHAQEHAGALGAGVHAH